MKLILTKIRKASYKSNGKTYFKFRVRIDKSDFDEITKVSENAVVLDEETLELILFLNQMLFDAYQDVKEFNDWFSSNVSQQEFKRLQEFSKTLKEEGLINVG